MKKKITLILKSVLVVFFSLTWFLFVQAEYEMIAKPELQNDFPLIKGIAAVYLTGFILLVLAAAVIFLLYLIKKSLKKDEI